MFTPNPEQTKSLVRWAIGVFGGAVAGWFAHKGWFTTQQVLDVLNSDAFAGLIVSAVGALWGLYTHTQANTIAATDAIPGVSGVVVKNTDDGQALAQALPSQTVAVQGTPHAMAVAR